MTSLTPVGLSGQRNTSLKVVSGGPKTLSAKVSKDQPRVSWSSTFINISETKIRPLSEAGLRAMTPDTRMLFSALFSSNSIPTPTNCPGCAPQRRTGLHQYFSM
jgi:hypothetical protein